MHKPFYREEHGRLILQVRVQPGARSDRVTGVEDGLLRVRLRAPAAEGRANEALREFLAEALGTAKSRVKILRGQNSRRKTLAVTGAQARPETLFLQGQNTA